MFFQRIKTPGLAHNAYLLGDKEQAILVDPRRDIDEYLKIGSSVSPGLSCSGAPA